MAERIQLALPLTRAPLSCMVQDIQERDHTKSPKVHIQIQ